MVIRGQIGWDGEDPESLTVPAGYDHVPKGKFVYCPVCDFRALASDIEAQRDHEDDHPNVSFERPKKEGADADAAEPK